MTRRFVLWFGLALAAIIAIAAVVDANYDRGGPDASVKSYCSYLINYGNKLPTLAEREAVGGNFTDTFFTTIGAPTRYSKFLRRLSDRSPSLTLDIVSLAYMFEDLATAINNSSDDAARIATGHAFLAERAPLLNVVGEWNADHCHT